MKWKFWQLLFANKLDAQNILDGGNLSLRLIVFFLIYILFYHISIKIYWGRNGLGKNYIWKGDSIVCVRICACVCLIERLEEREKEFSFLVFSLGHLFDRNLWTIKLMATLSNILVYFGLKCIEPQNENSKKYFEEYI